MKIQKCSVIPENRCELCKFFIQHYIKVPFINKDYIETDDGYCTNKRRKTVKSHWVCSGFIAKNK